MPQTDRYPSWVGLVYIFNLIVGTGALTLPAAFAEAGWLFSTFLLMFLAFVSFITVTFVIESIACANATIQWRIIQSQEINSEIRADSDSEVDNSNEATAILRVNRRYSLYRIDTKVELGEIAALYLNKFGHLLFFSSLCIYLFGDLTIYAAASGKTIVNLICINANETEDYSSKCFHFSDLARIDMYRIFVAVFALSVGPFAYFNVQKTKYLQLFTIGIRWCAFFIMVTLASIRLAKLGRQGHPELMNLKEVPALAGSSVYSFMCHHSLPALIAPISDKDRIMKKGRTFSGIIQSFVNSSKALEEEFLPAYATAEGKRAYEDTLNCLKKNFPQYVRELEGTADGANVPFHKLFLLHMDNIILSALGVEPTIQQAIGCSTICVNQDGQEILGHTEDALSDTLNHFYFVSAHIIPDKPCGKWKVKEEKFTSLCYAGHLPGYTMSYNQHGLVFSINTLSAKHLRSGKTPRHFLTRALLAAENFAAAQEILRDAGCGAGDGCSINMTFLKQEGNRVFHNVEMAPAGKTEESELNVLTAGPGENIIHCNKYLRLKIEEDNSNMSQSSVCRMATFKSYRSPQNKKDVITMLSDSTNTEFPVFRDNPRDHVTTIAVGIFDCKARTWSLYSDNPKENEPIVVLPLVLKD